MSYAAAASGSVRRIFFFQEPKATGFGIILVKV
jgi:hypothetical protein